MIFNLYYKLKKNILLKKFKNIKINNIKKFIYINKFNLLLKSKNSNKYLYNIIFYKYNNIKLLYIISNKYNLLLIKQLNFWYNILYISFIYNNIYIIKHIFTYF
ncbi:hypothetical protein AK88_07044 (apicoplast) [Plasmodium fragile]|uniref:Uncharacterized protein n=1 Tax=Plasmodium fragile TaxID=5857 RepID=A0A0D9QTE8_PLAFR|nr:uncharacterized protein AK88_07044 [Plasmodium fragile]KJP90340.1 hypothetical protein AK88_07044 [Plasmodium fragile]UTS56800.1 hypothetical protein [Plasmodium fragile]BBB58122.1 hypothetical protein [Plasmodium fragile]